MVSTSDGREDSLSNLFLVNLLVAMWVRTVAAADREKADSTGKRLRHELLVTRKCAGGRSTARNHAAERADDSHSEGTRGSPEEGDVTQTQTTCFLWIIALLGVGILLVVSTKIKPFLRWIGSKHGYVLADKNVPAPPSSDEQDEQVSKPVQEILLRDSPVNLLKSDRQQIRQDTRAHVISFPVNVSVTPRAAWSNSGDSKEYLHGSRWDSGERSSGSVG
ncbi:unnamed protein product [Lampetra planeri]